MRDVTYFWLLIGDVGYGYDIEAEVAPVVGFLLIVLGGADELFLLLIGDGVEAGAELGGSAEADFNKDAGVFLRVVHNEINFAELARPVAGNKLVAKVDEIVFGDIFAAPANNFRLMIHTLSLFICGIISLRVSMMMTVTIARPKM